MVFKSVPDEFFYCSSCETRMFFDLQHYLKKLGHVSDGVCRNYRKEYEAMLDELDDIEEYEVSFREWRDEQEDEESNIIFDEVFRDNKINSYTCPECGKKNQYIRLGYGKDYVINHY